MRLRGKRPRRVLCSVCGFEHGADVTHLPDEFGVREPDGRWIFIGTKEQCELRVKFIARMIKLDAELGKPADLQYASALRVEKRP